MLVDMHPHKPSNNIRKNKELESQQPRKLPTVGILLTFCFSECYCQAQFVFHRNTFQLTPDHKTYSTQTNQQVKHFNKITKADKFHR